MFDDSIRDVLRFNARTLYKGNTPSNNPVDVLSVDNNFLECNIAQSRIFRAKRSGTIHNFTMDVYPVYKIIEIFWGSMVNDGK